MGASTAENGSSSSSTPADDVAVWAVALWAGQRPGQRHALLLPAAELMRQALGQVGHTHAL
jgi:hypothetical protein